MFRYAHSEYLYLLFLLIPAAILIFWDFYKRKNALKEFASGEASKRLAPKKSGMKFFIKAGLVLTALFLLIFALANPQVGTKVEEVKQVGIDVYVLLDVSNSMNAEDIKPSRLEKAKHDIKNLIKKLQGDRIGLIVFAGRAYVQFPLTTDYSAANMFLDAVDTKSVPQQGTNIGEAIDLALKSFKKKTDTKKAIILITDGEDNEGGIDAGIKKANEEDVSIYTIGLGTPEGAPIPAYDASGKMIGYKKDRYNKVVLTKLDEATLKKIASETHGKYYNAQNGENELEMIYKDLSKLQKKEFGSKRITDFEDRFYYLLFPAILLLLFDFFLSRNKTRLMRKLESGGKE